MSITSRAFTTLQNNDTYLHSVKAVAAFLHLKKKAVCSGLRRMTKRGLVARQKSMVDGRWVYTVDSGTYGV